MTSGRVYRKNRMSPRRNCWERWVGLRSSMKRKRDWSEQMVFFLKLIYLFLAVLVLCCLCGLSLVALVGLFSSWGVWAFYCRGFPCCRAQAVGRMGFSIIDVVHKSSCPVACGIFPDQRWNPCPLHWQVDS